MQTFDQYGSNYRDVVQRSIDFVGLEYDFCVKAKARIIKQLAAELDRATDISLLDVGCGVGALHDHLGGTFARICGVDVSKVSIEAAKKRHPEIEYREAEGNRIPYPAAAFHIVTAINVLHHIDPQARSDFVLELKRVIRPSGLACIIEHNPLNPLTRLAVLRCPFDRDAHLLRAAQANRLLKAAGLAHVRASYFLLTPFSSAAASRFERWLSALPLGAQFVAVGERPGSDSNGLLRPQPLRHPEMGLK
jgi:2-polyprenyl-3-methyl-5-hydroxy-6-metoxy-1,4-benzoquinol methylase